MKTFAGLQDSGTGTSKKDCISKISELIDQQENTDWSEVPGISAAEASAWIGRLIEARETVQEGL